MEHAGPSSFSLSFQRYPDAWMPSLLFQINQLQDRKARSSKDHGSFLFEAFSGGFPSIFPSKPPAVPHNPKIPDTKEVWPGDIFLKDGRLGHVRHAWQ